MTNCIACNRIWQPTKEWKTKGMFSEKLYAIEFCECGLGKTKIDSLEDLTEVNANMYDNLEDRIKIYYKELHNHITIRYSQSLTEISKFTDGKKLLEVGSNIGFTLNIARNRGFKVSGCEINPKCRELSALLYKIMPLPDFFEVTENFDVIIMNDVLEHFPNPELAIEQARNLLNPNGILFIQLPNIDSKRAKKLKGEWDYVLAPDHTYHFTPKCLNELLQKGGFNLKWQRTATGIYDMVIIRMLPKNLQVRINKIINCNPFYFPRLYTRKDGELIQCIYQKKSNQCIN
jgi:2-polyprenyl-3-methyl-5-hydroxy-6-metoxy-1,4-benzoquinol methylase